MRNPVVPKYKTHPDFSQILRNNFSQQNHKLQKKIKNQAKDRPIHGELRCLIRTVLLILHIPPYHNVNMGLHTHICPSCQCPIWPNCYVYFCLTSNDCRYHAGLFTLLIFYAHRILYFELFYICYACVLFPRKHKMVISPSLNSLTE